MGKGSGRRLPSLAPAHALATDRTWTREIRVADLHRPREQGAAALEIDGRAYVFSQFHSAPIAPGSPCPCIAGARCPLNQLSARLESAEWSDAVIQYSASPSAYVMRAITAAGAPVFRAAALELWPGRMWLPMRWTLKSERATFFARTKTPAPSEPTLDGMVCSDCSAPRCGHDALLGGQVFASTLAEDLIARQPAGTAYGVTHPALPEVLVTYVMEGALEAHFGEARMRFATLDRRQCVTPDCEGPSRSCAHVRLAEMLAR